MYKTKCSSALQVDKSGWTFNPSVSAMIYPEQTTNFVRKGEFIDNDAMLTKFTDANDYQGALKYFGFKGTYDPNNGLFKGGTDPGITDPKTGDIFYNTTAFDGGYDKLYLTADHEYWHHNRVISGRYEKSGNTVNKEEFLNWRRNYRNQGVYKGFDREFFSSRVNGYGSDPSTGINPAYLARNFSYIQPFWHCIYKVSRLW